MISLETARRLKDAGLAWRPALHDFFAIPDRDLDDMVFVISDVQVTVEKMQGIQVCAFQGASEWALDSLITSEALWLPTEAQLRQALEDVLITEGRPELRLTGGLGGYRVEFRFGGRAHSFEAPEAGEAYAAGLLFALEELPGGVEAGEKGGDG